MMMKEKKGFTLIELMVALTLGLIILSVIMTLYINTIITSSDLIKSARINYDLNSALALMVSDIKRSGYWAGAKSDFNNPNNSFTQLKVPSESCILYAYDADANGSVDAKEYYGFKLKGTNIQVRLSGGAMDDCNASADDWQTLNVSEGNEQVEVTLLTFTTSYKCLRQRVGFVDISYESSCAMADATFGNLISGDNLIESRAIVIALEGHVKIDAVIIKKLVGQVKIRNNPFYTKP